MDVGIADPELVAPSCQEAVVLGVRCLELDHVESKKLVPKVTEKVEILRLRVKACCLNDADAIELIHVNFHFFFHIDPDTIFFIRNEHKVLGIVRVEEIWLHVELDFHFVFNFDFFFFEIVTEDAILFRKH